VAIWKVHCALSAIKFIHSKIKKKISK